MNSEILNSAIYQPGLDSHRNHLQVPLHFPMYVFNLLF